MVAVPRPILVQASGAPIFRVAAGGGTFNCEHCGLVLIEGFHNECVVGVDLQCHRCGQITRTPSRVSGQRFHTRVLLLGRGGRYLMDTVELSRDDTVTCDQELEAEQAEMGLRAAEQSPFALSLDGLDAVTGQLDLLSGGLFTPRVKSAERALAAGNRQFRENELAWAIVHLRSQVAKNEIAMDDDSMAAVTFVATTRQTLSRWRDHPTVSRRAKELCTDFRHAWSLMLAASYLEDAGNRICVNEAGSEPSPDLFIRTGISERLFLEVKAPLALAWPATGANRMQLRRAIERHLRKSHEQISTRRPGILILGATCTDLDFVRNLERAVRTVLRIKGSDHKGIAAITVVAIQSGTIRQANRGSLNVSTTFRVAPIKNPHYFKENPLRS